MPSKHSTEETCSKCGTVHVVTFEYSDFSPGNMDHEEADCVECGSRLVRERAFLITAQRKS